MRHFFLANAGGLLLGGLIVLVGGLLVIPAPWFALNLLQETLECARTGRPVRWQAAYDRPGAAYFVVEAPAEDGADSLAPHCRSSNAARFQFGGSGMPRLE